MQLRERERRAVVAVAGIATLALSAAVALRSLTSGAGPYLPTALSDLVTLSLSVFIESLPFVILGILLSTIVRVWVPQRLIDRALPRTPVLRRAVLSVTGVLLPVCECGNVPLARGLMMRGFTVAEAATFLLAAPILNPVTIITTYQAFGWNDGILIGRILGGFAIANLMGWLLSTVGDQQRLLTRGFQDHCAHDHAEQGGRTRQSLLGFAEELSVLLPALVIGSLLAGLIQVGVSRELLIALGEHPLWSVLALIALAFVVSICSSVDAFFILGLAALFMPGGIVAFLIFGAMLDIKMLVLLRTTFTARTLVFFVVVVLLCTLAIGWGVNLVV